MKKTLTIMLLAALCLTACGSINTDTDQETSQTTTDSATESSATAASSEGSSTAAPGYELSIPDEFSQLEIEGMEFYYAAEDGSSVSLNLQPKDPDFSQVSAELLETSLASAFSQTYGENIDITDNYFTTKNISGYPAYQYCISYELQGTGVTQIIIGIDADQTYTFTYTDLTGSWTDSFETSAGTITLTTE
mgnify:CR=1 FL=1